MSFGVFLDPLIPNESWDHLNWCKNLELSDNFCNSKFERNQFINVWMHAMISNFPGFNTAYCKVISEYLICVASSTLINWNGREKLNITFFTFHWTYNLLSGTTVDFITSFLHSSRFSAFHSSIFNSRPIHSIMLSSHCFLCLPLSLPPWTVPCGTVLASPDDRVTCPYHFSLRLFTEVRRSSHGPITFPILAFTSSLVLWSLYEILEIWRNISSPMPVSLFQCLLLWSMFHTLTKIWTWPGNTSVWSWSWWRCSCHSRWL